MVFTLLGHWLFLYLALCVCTLLSRHMITVIYTNLLKIMAQSIETSFVHHRGQKCYSATHLEEQKKYAIYSIQRELLH